MKRPTLLAIALALWATSALAQQGFEPSMPSRIPNQAAQPQAQPSSPTLEVPQVPQPMLGCWTGITMPVQTQTFLPGARIVSNAIHICFDPQPTFRSDDASGTETSEREVTVTGSGPDWVQFDEHFTSFDLSNSKSVSVQAMFHCRMVQSQMACQGAINSTVDGKPNAYGTWVATLDREN
jgi:hypothetical protein